MRIAAGHHAELHLAGICLGVGDEFGQCFEGHAGVGCQYGGVVQQSDADHVKSLYAVIDKSCDLGDHRLAMEEKGSVSIGVGVKNALHADRPATAGDVYHSKALTKFLFEVLGEEAGIKVGITTGSNRDDDLNGLFRIGGCRICLCCSTFLGSCREQAEACDQCQDGNDDNKT